MPAASTGRWAALNDKRELTMRNDPMPLAVHLVKSARAAGDDPGETSQAIITELNRARENNDEAIAEAVCGLSWMTLNLLGDVEQAGGDIDALLAEYLPDQEASHG